MRHEGFVNQGCLHKGITLQSRVLDHLEIPAHSLVSQFVSFLIRKLLKSVVDPVDHLSFASVEFI